MFKVHVDFSTNDLFGNVNYYYMFIDFGVSLKKWSYWIVLHSIYVFWTDGSDIMKYTDFFPVFHIHTKGSNETIVTYV